jgi:HK97 family phage major capsid protein
MFVPSTVGANIDVTWRLMSQIAVGGEAWLQDDLARSIAVEVDRVALAGSGTGQPLGLFGVSGVGSVAIGADGGDPTRATLISLKSTVGTANGDATVGARLGWLTSPQGRAKLRSIDGSSAGSGRWLWDDAGLGDGGDSILGQPAFATMNVPANLTKGNGTNLTALVYGNWRDLLVNMFSAVDLMVNHYLQSTTGVVRFTALQDVGVCLRHAASFAKCLAELKHSAPQSVAALELEAMLLKARNPAGTSLPKVRDLLLERFTDLCSHIHNA